VWKLYALNFKTLLKETKENLNYVPVSPQKDAQNYESSEKRKLKPQEDITSHPLG
jgi:hypothetical protein